MSKGKVPSAEVPELGEAAPQPALCDASGTGRDGAASGARAAAPEAHSPPGGVPAGGTSQAPAPPAVAANTGDASTGDAGAAAPAGATPASAPPESTPPPATAAEWSKQAYDVEYNLQMRGLACLNWLTNPKCRCVRCQVAREWAKDAAKNAKVGAAADFKRLFGRGSASRRTAG